MSKFKKWDGSDATVEEYVTSRLDGSDPKRANAEEAVEISHGILAAFARLIHVLAERKVLRAKDVEFVVEQE